MLGSVTRYWGSLDGIRVKISRQKLESSELDRLRKRGILIFSWKIVSCNISLGRPGVDVHVKHEGCSAVMQLQFLINEGALISATTDDTLHLWNFRQKIPQVVQSLKFQRDRSVLFFSFFFSRLFLIRLIPLLPLFYNMLLFIIESFVFSLRNRTDPDVIEWHRTFDVII